MNKTGTQVLTDVYSWLRGSALAELVSGGVYYAETRPRDSKLEDIVIVFLSGLATQMQKGIVSVKIYVPDIDPYGNGVMVENGARTAELQRIVQDWLDSYPAAKTDYLIELQDTITTVEDVDIQQHFVSVMLHYTLFNE